MPRRAKIVATLGPATDDPAILEAVLRAGVDVARVNFSHGAPEAQLPRIELLRATAAKVGKIVALLADLPGPKLRVTIPAARTLVAGSTVHFALGQHPVEPDDLTITEPELLADVRPGQRILLNDGRLQMVAGESAGGRLAATVTVGGLLETKKGVNLPDTTLSGPTVTPQDRAAVAVAAQAKADWLAMSFVRGPEAADELRAVVNQFDKFSPRILAKIERPEAVRNAAAVVAAFDAIMVARGDLGVEIPLEQVPPVQKQLIAIARAAGKPVITATDMLDSMRENPRPTRAEASDVANAIYDGTDAVMLSGETAVGKYPVEAVECMAKIAAEAEQHSDEVYHPPAFFTGTFAIDDPMAAAACELAEEMNAVAIITPTRSGRTARLVAKHRPKARLVAPAAAAAILRRMAVMWGVIPVPMAPLAANGDRMSAAVRDAFLGGAVAENDLVVVLAGHPFEGGQRAPTIRVVRVGEGGAATVP